MGKTKVFVSVTKALCVAVSVTITLGGCAATQKIHVNSEPPGARVLVNDVQLGRTPAEIKLSKKGPAPVLLFEKEGYEPAEATLQRSFSAWKVLTLVGVLGAVAVTQFLEEGTGKGSATAAGVGVAAGAAVGVVSGFTTGQFYNLKPDEVLVVLKEIEKSEETPGGR